MRLLLLAALAVLMSITSSLSDEGALERGRATAEAFLAGETAVVWARMTPQMQSALGSEQGLREFREQLERDMGTEADVLSEDVVQGPDGVQLYVRTSRWNTDTDMRLQVAFEPQGGLISGFVVQPVPVAAESRFLSYRTRADLRLPFDGEWFVFWGGRTIDENYHAADRGQRFALDLVVHEDGVSHRGDANALDSYFCWGRPILAPADGTVVAVVGDLPDQPIGQTDARNPAGNHVVIDFGNDEFGFLAHLQAGSVSVAEGDSVQAGEPVGLCGNSGNTSEPHLHFHLQTTPELGTGEGLPAQFRTYLADGTPVAEGEPMRGQTVSPTPPLR